MLSQDVQAEVDEVAKALSTVDNGANGAVDPFDKTMGDALLEVVEDLVPPIP